MYRSNKAFLGSVKLDLKSFSLDVDAKAVSNNSSPDKKNTWMLAQIPLT